jgi:hypothetical protein
MEDARTNLAQVGSQAAFCETHGLHYDPRSTGCALCTRARSAEKGRHGSSGVALAAIVVITGILAGIWILQYPEPAKWFESADGALLEAQKPAPPPVDRRTVRQLQEVAAELRRLIGVGRHGASTGEQVFVGDRGPLNWLRDTTS